jgi:hypothetical protein
MRFRRRRSRSLPKEQAPPTLAYPYYVDSHGLRGLADSLSIELPTIREKKKSKRVTGQVHGLGGEAGWEEGSQLEGHIHLNVLAAQLKRNVAYREIVDVLGLIPQVHDRGILDAALSHVKNMPAEESPDALSEQLQLAYEVERTREIASAKRQELQQVALQNQLVILRGTFEAIACDTDPTCVRLTHLEPSEVISESVDTPEGDILSGAAEMPMPEDVGIEAVLPAKDAFTAVGRERLNRGAPFYGRLIGHSASFDKGSGVLTCSTYAVWGMPRPAELLANPRHYDFLEGR